MTHIADLASLGYLGMRDETVDQLLDARTTQYGLRITDIQLTDMTYKLDDVGDIQFSSFYPKKDGERRIGSWGYAVPATYQKGGESLPIGNELFDADDRYQAQEVNTWEDRVYPDGTPGIVISSTDEIEEQKLFFPATFDLVAHHRGDSPPDLSSRVYDIDNAGKVDTEKWAGLHSAWWVKELPEKKGLIRFGKDAHGLAWNLRRSAGDSTGYGLFVDLGDLQSVGSGRSTAVRVTPKDVLALASWQMGGPFHPGHQSRDKHQIGVNEEGEALNSGHFSTDSIFYRNEVEDAPLDFGQGQYPQVQDFGFPWKVHLKYDPFPIHTWHPGGGARGLWSWHTKMPFLVTIPPDTPPGTPPDWPPYIPEEPGGGNPPGGGKTPGGGGDLGGGNRGPIVVPIPSEPDDSNPQLPRELVPIGEGFKSTPDYQPGGSVRTPGIYESRTDEPDDIDFETRQPNDGPPYANLSTWMKMQMPGIAFQAHPARTLQRYGKHSPDPGEGFISGLRENYPVTAQMEAFGPEKTPGRMDINEGRKTYVPGTSKGGLVVFPPEIGMRSYLDGFKAPSGINKSNVDFIFFKENVRTFWGQPDPVLGEGINGIGCFLNSNGDLQFNSIDEVGASDEGSFILFNLPISIQGTSPPPLYLWNTDTGSADVSSGYLLFASYTSSSTRTMRLRKHHPTSGVQALGIYDGTTEQVSIDEYGVLHLTPATEAQAATRSGFGKYFGNSSDLNKPYYRGPGGTLYDLSGASNIAKLTEGVITLGSGGPPVRTGNTTSSVVAFTPYGGNRVAVYNTTDSIWEILEFSEIYTSFPSTTDTVYDMFVYNNSGSLAFELVAWTSTTARATALTLQDGVYVKSGDASKKYVGSVSTTSTTGWGADTDTQRFVWNYYNRRRKELLATVSTASWTYATSTWRVFAGGTTNVEVLIGVIEDSIFLQAGIELSSSGSLFAYYVGIGDNTTTTNSAYQQGLGGGSGLSNSGDFCQHISSYHRRPAGVGRRKYYPLEYGGAAAANCLGNYSNLRTTGITGHIFC
ncbi:MAG: hypothetical protein KDD43_00165 [Bdellovibrionales bacterium]|nr:hypothetical protein [Bdellovibrionales bacterium]